MTMTNTVARTHILNVFIIFALSLMGCMALTIKFGTPLPTVHDEFAYLLLGETISNGHWSYPAHELKSFFTTFHILQEPTYSSKYLPLTGIIIAVGYLLGAPIMGIWLSVGAMGISYYYVTTAILSNRMSLFVALWGVFHFGVLSYWSHTFWGGNGNAIAGALILGSTLHSLKRSKLTHLIVLALGLSLLIISRPFEGAFFCIPIGLLYFHKVLLPTIQIRKYKALLLASLIPFLGLVLGVTILAHQNKHVTGKWTKFPHTQYHETYFPETTRFPWEEERSPPENRPKEFDEFARAAIQHNNLRFKHPLTKTWITFSSWSKFYISIPVIISIGVLTLMLTPLKSVTNLIILSLLIIQLPITILSASSGHLHYTAAWSTVSVCLLALGVKSSNFHKHTPIMWSIILLTLPTLRFATTIATDFKINDNVPSSWIPGEWKNFANARQSIHDLVLHADLKKSHVILISYKSGHSPHQEWVYNGADIDNQTVVWARDLGDKENEKIFSYYPDRCFWKLSIGSPYSKPDLQKLTP